MIRNLRFVLLMAILICQKPQAQLTVKENPIPRQVQHISTVQDTPKKIKALSIGDRVPDFQLNLLNYPSPVANLNSFKGKLVILDFWASWCFSCLLAIPKLSKLQNEFSDRLQIIYVNSTESSGDKREKVERAVKKYFPDGPLPFLISYNDSIALKLFPHFSLPHYVWITPEGFVKAITDGEAVTAKNIKSILENENLELSLPIKMDYIPNKLMDLSLDGQPTIDENLAFYSIFKKGKIEGLSSINSTHEIPIRNGAARIYRGISLRNVSLIELFETAANYLKNGPKGEFRKRLILETINTSRLFFDSLKMAREAWEKDNFYTYELVLPDDRVKNIEEYIWRDINLYSGYTIRIENREVKCYLLTATDKLKTDPSKAGKGSSMTSKDGVYILENASLQTISSILDKNPQLTHPVIAATTRNIKVDLSFDYEHLDLKKLRHQLAICGLELKEAIQKIDVFVVSENTN